MSAEKRKALGKGLSALLNDSDNVFPNKKTNASQPAEVNNLGSVNDININQIEVNPFQPRTEFDQQALSELSDSIKLQGLIQPITVRRVTEGKYQLISGERRLRASKLAGLKEIPAGTTLLRLWCLCGQTTGLQWRPKGFRSACRYLLLSLLLLMV
ncbi:MAG: ParB/RepB/Spo0J family partition protein [Sphingobacteriales bacterium]|nr:MAG: ParB/RepB/Spo0J family partition protein [Sphingobacteriales bacterium]